MSKTKDKSSVHSGDSLPRLKETIIQKCKNGQESVETLVTAISRDCGYSRDKVVSAIMELEEQHDISIEAKEPYVEFSLYALSPLATWFWTTCSVVIISIFLSFISTGVAIYIRYSLGAALVLFLPGNSIIGLLYYRRNDISDSARYALSFAASLALVPIIGIFVNFTPAGLTLINVELALAFLVVLMNACTLWRKYSLYKLELLTRGR